MRYSASKFFYGYAEICMDTGCLLSMAWTDGDGEKNFTPSATTDAFTCLRISGEMAELAEGARLLSECTV
jgi:hypothetical protein